MLSMRQICLSDPSEAERSGHICLSMAKIKEFQNIQPHANAYAQHLRGAAPPHYSADLFFTYTLCDPQPDEAMHPSLQNSRNSAAAAVCPSPVRC